nr:hypothetical protein [Dendronalium phyllosphericum CENA369]
AGGDEGDEGAGGDEGDEGAGGDEGDEGDGGDGGEKLLTQHSLLLKTDPNSALSTIYY